MKIKNIVCCSVLILLIIPLVSKADNSTNTRNVSVSITYPYYRSIEKNDYEAIPGGDALYPIKEDRVEQKVGRSAFFNFLIEHTVPNLPPFNNLFASEKSSKKNEDRSSQAYIDRYKVAGCITEHTAKVYNKPSSFSPSSPSKIDARILKACKNSTNIKNNYYANYENNVVDYAPSIDQYNAKGESSITYTNANEIITHYLKQDSKVVLNISTPPENLCISYARYLGNMCAKQAVTTFLPGGFILSSSGFVTRTTSELENLIFKNNPTWAVPIKVSAYSLTPVLDGDNNIVYDQKIIPCSAIKVLGKKLNSDCATNVNIREKDMVKDITPVVDSSKYYGFDVVVNGDPVIVKTNVFAGIIDSLVAAVYQPEDGQITLDNEGFMVVPDDDITYLPLSPFTQEVAPNKPIATPSAQPTAPTPSTPYMISVTPLTFKVGDPIVITINGVNFDGVIPELISISDKSGNLTPTLLSSSPTQLKISVPAIPIGTYNIDFLTSKGISNTKTFTVTPATTGANSTSVLNALLNWWGI